MARFVIEEGVKKIKEGDCRSAARLITLLEEGNEEAKVAMKKLYPHTGKAVIIGITGGAGAGKSTLVDGLIEGLRALDKRVGAVVVDPTSPFSGGAFLGDRLRMQRHTRDDGVFIRSMASRNTQGGLAKTTSETIRVMEAMGMDVILVETIGVGQDEVDIIQVAQTSVLVVTPASGDEIQALKAGLMEIADVFVVNKSDMDGATQALLSIETALSLKMYSDNTWRPKIVQTIAKEGEGIDKLIEAIQEHQNFIRSEGELDKINAQRIEHELGLIFKDEIENIIFRELKGKGKKMKYIQDIKEGKNDPYSVIEEVFHIFSQKQHTTDKQ